MKNYLKKQIGISLAVIALLLAGAVQTGVHAQDKGSASADEQSADRAVGALGNDYHPG